ncbi:MAG TPA: ethanolamine ammonia-lyase subunit EutC [Isosphaeraceae bacterium]|jgi:ethanolamine ammonia-lyase small subunit|nr:ethanolamine ammonia-lyase subunit EutC [Isosphaeraceae bacterium]
MQHAPDPIPDSRDDLLAAIRARTPARLLVGRSGPAYRTATQLALRGDHAAALDAVRTELDPTRDFGQEFLDRWKLFEVRSGAASKDEFLMRPDLGRSFSPEGAAEISNRCPRGAVIQVVVADGLSAAAVAAQVPSLLPLLEQGAREREWRFGQPFVVRYGRVGLLNEIGALLDPTVAVLLIGERPGLATAESLSAYLAFRPRPGNTDAVRNLISNIHARGVPPADAAPRILDLAGQMIQLQKSGTSVKENLRAIGTPPLLVRK